MQIDPSPPGTADEPTTDLDAVRRVEELIQTLERRATGIREEAQRSAEAAGRASRAAGDAEAAQRTLEEAMRVAATSREAADRAAAAAKRFDERHKTAVQALGTAEKEIGQVARYAEARTQRAKDAELALRSLLKDASGKRDALDNARALAFEAHALAKSAGADIDTRLAALESQLSYRLDLAHGRIEKLTGPGWLSPKMRAAAELLALFLFVLGGIIVWNQSGTNRMLRGQIAQLETTLASVSSQVARVEASVDQASSEVGTLAAQVESDLQARQQRALLAVTPTAVVNSTTDPARGGAAAAALRAWGGDVAVTQSHRFSDAVTIDGAPPDRRTRVYYRQGQRAPAEALASLVDGVAYAGSNYFDWAEVGVPDDVAVALVVGLDWDVAAWRRAAAR